ncbi:MAG TPA: TraB/GumN family protein [Kofleriaceae bacterium]|nr:TraB/GumN family protein [Kofleriaceae bacterium]
MKRVALLAALAAALGGAFTTASAPGALDRPLLWSADKDGRTTYLFGTMHAGIDAEARLPAIVWRALDAAPAFAMETDLDRAAPAGPPPTGSLREALGPAYWEKLEAALGTAGAREVEYLRPMIAASLLSLRGLPRTPQMDRALAERAAAEHKRVVFLEPVSRQLALLARWIDVKALRLLLDELPASEQRSQAMLAAYVDGDERRILAINDRERAAALRHGYTAAEYDREMDDLLYGRNASWIAPIEQLHAAGGGFVAVGALHLVGPRSVLDLLAQRGFRVTRVAP